jgi:hypothetical protein
VITKLRRHDENDMIARFGLPALLAFQFHMIGRVDDCIKWYKEKVGAHDNHPEKCAKARLAWSKNVREERDAPWQHVFGCMDPMFCVLLNVGIWLEAYHGSVPSARDRPFLFCFNDEMDMKKSFEKAKTKVYDILKPIFVDVGLDTEGLLGSHSIRKFASTWVRSNGISKDDKEHRGCWKDSKRVSDRYDEIQLDYVDAMVGSTLCIGGVCHYIVEDAACVGARSDAP